MIVIIAIASAIIAPAYFRLFSESSFDGSVSRLEAFLATAHRQAVALDEDVQVTYDVSSHSFVMETPLPPPVYDIPQALANDPAAAPTSSPNQNQNQTRGFTMPTDIRVVDMETTGSSSMVNSSNTGNVIRFHGDGTSSSSIILLGDDHNHSAALQIVPASGSVRRTNPISLESAQ